MLANRDTHDNFAPWIMQGIFLVALMVLWTVATESGSVSQFLLPSPVGVATALWQLVRSGDFLPDLGVTLVELVTAFATSTVAGLLVGFLVSRARYSVRVFEPLLASLYAVPVVLFLPLFILLFGLGEPSKIAIGVATSFFPIVLSAIVGFGNVEPIYIKVARSMGCSNGQLFRCVMLRAALPVVVTGLRMGFVVAFLSILGAETIASYQGLGHRIVEKAQNLETEAMFANIVLVILISVLLNVLLGNLEKRLGGRP